MSRRGYRVFVFRFRPSYWWLWTGRDYDYKTHLELVKAHPSVAVGLRRHGVRRGRVAWVHEG